ncbi:hypothetical protein [Pseudoxanthomonas sp. J35]|uniref:hypothetical protein n=1 Tax=Pseudoxanthomonas sp. J35 TaxID=935852 RepID=UPI00048F2DD6|nr:hypothetical protein [Pseudoxanthomonas sp. J35]
MYKLLILSVLALAPVAAGATINASGESFSPEKGLDLARSFDAQRTAILQALADGETYSEIGAEERRQVRASLDRIDALLNGVQDVNQLSERDKVEVFNEQERINTLLTRAREDSRLVCVREKKVGSHRATNNCQTVAERRRAHEQTQNALMNNRGVRLPMAN